MSAALPSPTLGGAPARGRLRAAATGRGGGRLHRPCAGTRVWTDERLARLANMVEDGLPASEIAAALGVSDRAVHDARKRYGIRASRAIHLTAAAVARRFGVTAHGTVDVWIARGYLAVLAAPDRPRSGVPTHIAESAVLDFIDDEATWHLWVVEQIRHEPWRRYAERVRGPVRFLTVGEVAERFCCSPKTASTWCRTGRLPSRRHGRTYLVREDDLAGFELPRIGGPRAGGRP